MDCYEISEETLAIIPLIGYKSKVIEKERELIINRTPFEIIKDSCEYFGSSYLGRHKGTKRLIGVSHKSPIIVEETKEIIFFPTTSPRLDECCWISLKYVKELLNKKDYSSIIFENNYNLELEISYGSLTNQILRASRLESVLRKRKKVTII